MPKSKEDWKMKKYQLIKRLPITFDENVKEDIKELMNWTEEQFEYNTIKIKENAKK